MFRIFSGRHLNMFTCLAVAEIFYFLDLGYDRSVLPALFFCICLLHDLPYSMSEFDFLLFKVKVI